MAFLEAVGGLLKGAAGALIGGSIDRFNDRRSRQQEYNFYRDQGATIREILGTGGVGTGSTAASTVLGNQQAELSRLKMIQDYEQEQRELDRAVAMRGQDASLRSSEIQAGASIFGSQTQERIADARLALEQDRFRNIDLPQGLNDIATSTPQWRRQELLARMGVDNAIATAILGSRGIDIMDPDTLSRMSQSEFRQLIRDIYGYQSTVFGETAGSSTVIREGIQEGANDFMNLWDQMWNRDRPEMSRPDTRNRGRRTN